MHRKTLPTLPLLLIVLALAVPAVASGQTGGLDEYQEGAPTAGGEQSGVPGGTNHGGDGTRGGNGQANGSGNQGGSSDPSGSATTPAPTGQANATQTPAGGGSTASANQNTSQGRGAAEARTGDAAGGRADSSRASTPSDTAVAVPSQVSATVPAVDDGGWDLDGVLAIALVLLAVGVIGTFLYQRKYGVVAPAPNRPAHSSS